MQERPTRRGTCCVRKCVGMRGVVQRWVNIGTLAAFDGAMRLPVLLVVILLASNLNAVEHREPKDYRADTAEIPLPGDLVTNLEVPTKPILLGTSWVLHYVIHNRNISELTWMHGGDYRGARPTRVWLEASAPDGTWAVDPLRHTSVNDMGGIGGGITIPPFGSSAITVIPGDYVRLDRPGKWTLRMFHDLGIGPPQGDEDPRWATATVELVMPDETQARAVLAQHERLVAAALDDRTGHRWPTVGERHHAGPDFKSMAFPIFLPLLVEKTRQGSRMAIDGIAAMPTSEACDALLDLLQVPAAAAPAMEIEYGGVSRAHPWNLVLNALSERLPPPLTEQKWAGTGDPALLATMDEPRKLRTQQAAMALAHHADEDIRRAAGVLLSRFPLTSDALLSLIETTVTGARDTSAFHSLLAAYRSSGAPVPDPMTSAAAAMVWLDHLLNNRNQRPDGWKESLAKLLIHPAPRVREWAVMILPRDEPERWLPFVAKALQDVDHDVRSRAIGSANDYPGPMLIPFLQAVMLRDPNATYAAEVVGRIAGKTAAAQAWINYLENSRVGFVATSNSLSSLFQVIGPLQARSNWTVEHQTDAAELHAIAERLRAFVLNHSKAIEGGTLGLPDESWPIDLLPDGWWIVLPDAKTWPPGRR